MVRPKPRHGRVCARIVYLLSQWAGEAGFEVYANDVGVLTERDPDTVRGPDVAAFRRDRIPDETGDWFETGPDLCIEVRSPSNTLRDLRQKANEYLAIGSEVVWIVDPDAVWVEVITPDGRLLLDADDAIPAHPSLPGLSLSVADLFARP